MSRFLLSLAVLGLVACDKAPAATPGTTTSAAPSKPTPARATFTVDGKEVPIVSVLAWDLDIAGSLVPQLTFYAEEVACSERLTHVGTRLYSAGLIPEGFALGGPYKLPNWSFTGKPDMVPLDSATVTITKSTVTEVEGLASYTSKLCSLQTDCTTDADCGDGQSCFTDFNVCTVPCPFSLEGEFVARRCEVYGR